ncbi:MAG TPA: EF-hand domain-containing protein [Stenotrophomonas sp.]|nr:EF-hand domain-containing protein [Stenotrophomonas sp.]
MKHRKPLFVLSTVLAAALAMPAFAQSAQSGAAQPQQGASGGGQTWASVDTDSDGAISKQEAQVNAGLAQIFDQADGDTNGKLTPEEYKAYVAKQQAGANSAPQQQN